MSETRFLTIGEFAAATQLSQKALRLYDEQRLLAPVRTDVQSGYRYYRTDQVAVGRLIRSLRDMDLPLASIARILAVERDSMRALLDEAAADVDRRYAREKRAYQQALLQLGPSRRAAAIAVVRRPRPSMLAAALRIRTDRDRLVLRSRSAYESLRARLGSEAFDSSADIYCNLLEAPSEEESDLEVLIPVRSTAFPAEVEVATRELRASECAVVAVVGDGVPHDLAAYIDALFDWFDRNGLRALETPWIALSADRSTASEILWAFEDGSGT